MMTGQQINLLLIDDNPEDVRLIRKMLSETTRFRFALVIAERLSDGLSQLANSTFDAVLLDLSLPDSHGFRTLEAIRAAASHATIIVLTERDDDMDVEALQKGAADYLVKEEVTSSLLARAISYAIERRQIAQSLKESEEQYRLLAETATDFVVVHDIEGRITYVNRPARDFWGYDQDDLLGKSIADLLPADQLNGLRQRRDQRLAGNTEQNLYEIECVCKSGQHVPVEVSSSPIIKDGEITGVLLVARDITQRKQAEEQIRYQANLLQNVSDAIISTDMTFAIVSWNRAAELMYGWRADEVLGKIFRDVIKPEYPHTMRDVVLREFADRGSWEGEVFHFRKDGGRLNLYVRTSLIKDDAGQPLGMVTINRDLTAFRRSEEALRQSQRRLATLMSNLPGMAYRCQNDSQWTMEFVSEGCTALTGYSPSDLLHNRTIAFGELIHETDRADVWDSIQAAIRDGQPFQLTYRILTADGTPKWVWEQGRIVNDAHDGPEMLEGFITDITTRMQLEQTLTRRVQELNVLYDASQRLSQLLDLDAIYETLHGVIRQIMDCDWLVISDYDPAAELIACAYGFAEGAKIDVSALPSLPLAPEGKGTQSTVIRTGESLYFPDLKAGLERSQNVYTVRSDGAIVDREEAQDGLHPQSAFIVPMKHLGQVIGVVQVKSFRPDAYSENKQRILESLTHQAATAISNARLFQQVQAELFERKQAEAALVKSTHRLNILHNIDRAILSAQTPEIIAQVALEHIQGIVDYQRIFVLAFDLETDAARVLALADKGTSNLAPGAVLRPDEILKYDELRGRKPVLIDDMTGGGGALEQALLANGIQSIVNLPFFAHDKLVGMIGWGRCEPGIPPDEHVEVVREVGDQLAVAIHQAHLYQSEREQRRYAEVLSEMAAAMNGMLSVDDVLNTIAANVERVVSYDAVHIMLVEAEMVRTARQRGFERYGVEAETAYFSEPISTLSGLRQMAMTRQPFTIPDVRKHSKWMHHRMSEWVRSYAGAPICYDDEVIGFVVVLSDTPGFYSDWHARRLQGLADQAAIAIRNAQLYEELELYSEHLELVVAKRTIELQQREAQYRAIVEDQTELIARALPDGTLTFVNDALCRYFASSPHALLGTNFKTFISEDSYAVWMAQLAALDPDNLAPTTEAHTIAAGGEKRWMEWTARQILDQAGKQIGLQFVGRDITQRKQAEEDMRRALAREMEINEMRSRFVSMASHDLRTPLAVIQSNTDVLKRYGDRLTESRKHEKLDQIHLTIQRMVELLDDILLIGRAEAGKLEFNPEQVELETFCCDILVELQTSIGIAHTFDFTVAGEGKPVRLDPKLLRHILYNLLSNAIKYSPEGSTVSFALRFEQEQVAITVSDEGIGIPEDDQKHLFSSFHRAENVGKVPGTGLGLAIVKQAVELHGGDITCDSTEGVGTTFTVTLPIRDLATANP